jgi:hypothetical protein
VKRSASTALCECRQSNCLYANVGKLAQALRKLH